MRARSKVTIVCVVIVVMLGLASTPADASTIVISTSDNQLQPGVDNQGWVSGVLANGNTTNDNYFTGQLFGDELRSYFIFDLSSVVGTVVSARLDLRRYDSSPGTIEFFDVSAPASSLIATRGGPANAGLFTDLGSGTSYGSFAIGGGSSADILSFTLNAAMLANLNAASGYFAIGARAMSGGWFFGYSSFEPGNTAPDQNFTQQLVLETVPVPEPTSLLLFSTGALGLIRRARHARQR